ncbi:MAG: methylenetetrahydrofolate reductase [Candidatus Auribacterota bacterium]|jgi:5,10-methylenetetrahydrofolate reductase|nr:methylenetetrahydrofolate reductase [Candidatus Auribacterota bacterium]
MSNLRKKLEARTPVITGELTPPKGTDTKQFLDDATTIGKCVDAINITDNPRASMRMGSLGGAYLLKQINIEPIFQITGRDRNRISLQSDLLSAWTMGIENVLVTTGDNVSAGDHKGAKPVFDLDSTQMLYALHNLNNGKDLEGNPLCGATGFCYGAAVNPFLTPEELNFIRIRQKIQQGVSFFQTQPVFEIPVFESFINAYNGLQKTVPVIAGILILKSAQMARFVNSNISGIRIPDNIISGLENSQNQLEYGISLAVDLGKSLLGMVSGIHIMSIGLEHRVEGIINAIKGRTD